MAEQSSIIAADEPEDLLTEGQPAERRPSKPYRGSRDQEMRGAMPAHDAYGDQWDQQPLTFPTQDLPPRPGFVQRLVRVKLNGQDDAANLMRSMSEGWRPRLASTVPAGFFANSVKLNLGEGKNYGDVIGSHDMVLMERPERLHREFVQRRENYQQDLSRLVGEMVEGQAGRAIKALGGEVGAEETRHRVGKNPLLADDD